jgi:glycyl-tRNA synthetase
VQLKRNVQRLWWRRFVTEREDMVGMDAAIVTHPTIWKAAGHVDNFVDPLMECSACHTRVRPDKAIEEATGTAPDSALTLEQLGLAAQRANVTCPKCGLRAFSAPRHFNLLCRTSFGQQGEEAFLRPETAQGIFVNFAAIVGTVRRALPFGVAQIGKAFRNEISPRNFLFRTREFDQMEIEFFCEPSEASTHFARWVSDYHAWLMAMGLRPDSLRLVEYERSRLAHYAAATTDIEFHFPFGWGELMGIANRTDHDLRQHSAACGRELKFQDPRNPQRAPFFPHVIEPSIGLDRLVFALLCDAYHEETYRAANGESAQRLVLRLHPELAPVRFAVLPLVKNNEDLVSKARKLAHDLRLAASPFEHVVEFDASGSIGKRYRRFDEIGTPFCVTVDHESLRDDAVTVYERDTQQQVRLGVDELLRVARRGGGDFSSASTRAP